ncbi:MAG: InlB B-repeat-containing protein [Ruminococcus sp.]|nr:InlB B-repeat-containing protein [Candidatus Copronaster equi]
MKKIISYLIIALILINSLSICSFATDTIRSSVDAKPTGSFVTGGEPMNIKGWAFDITGATVTCYYKIDNGSEIPTDPVKRTDVQNAFPDECSQLNCGFDQYISVDNISPGTHTFYFYAKSSTSTKLLAQTTFTVSGLKTDCNAIPSGKYSVEENSTLFICGWAINYDGSNTDCFYQIDDNTEVFLKHRDRSDVQAVYDFAPLDSGFNYQIPISEFTLGKHKLTLIARSGSISKIIATSEVEITSTDTVFKYSSDFYLKNTYVEGSTQLVHLGGWAFNINDLPVRCYYQIDNNTPVQLEPDTRNDVVSAFPDICTQADCGYKQDISIAGLSKGVHTYKVIAKCERVSEVIKQTEFTVISQNGEIKGHSEHTPSGTINLSSNCYTRVQGWGYDTSAREVKFYGKFDNGSEFFLTKEERPDVINSCSDCFRTDSGYNQQIYLGNLTSGEHTFTVIARNDSKVKEINTSSFTITKQDYTVRFNANGGNNAPSQIKKSFGKNLVLPNTVPTRSYYKFVEWNTSSNGSGEAFKAGDSYRKNADAQLYAIWEHEKIELESNSKLSFDEKDKLIYGSALSEMNIDELKNSFVNTTVSVNANRVVTGTQISFLDDNGVYDTASTVILGDTNCDAEINAMDAVVAEMISGGLLTKNQVSKAVSSAADCQRDGKINDNDVKKLSATGIGLDSVDGDAVKSRGLYDTDFEIITGSVIADKIMFNGEYIPVQTEANNIIINSECEKFNYFGLKYTSSTYAQGTITYEIDDIQYSEKFFLEPDENGEFYSFIDGVFDKLRSGKIISLSFSPLNADDLNLTVTGFSVFNRQIPETVTYINNSFIKIGVNLDWGGSLSYYEDLDSNVQAVSDNGIIRIDSNAAQRYNTQSLNDSVNLINCHDTGRLVQQSYYGTENYDMGFFNGHYCAYNPVQGGNMYNDSSKIVDLRVESDKLYVKCRPLDWAKEKEYITDSYMETTYSFCDNSLKTQCRFVDFSGYDPAQRGQELPAFYGAATMDKFVYYSGKSPWTDDELSSMKGLDEYLYAHYPSVTPTEQWGALTGEFSDSLSIGLYVPQCEYMLAGVYGSVTEQTENPDISNPTSYLAGGRMMLFQSFTPIEYDYYISTGTVDEVRDTFKNIHDN